MNIVYSSDENYVQHMGISIFSLLQNNTEVDEITIYILSNDISDESKKKLNDIVINQFRRNIVFIDFTLYKDLSLKMEWPISISAYARLFLSEMLPEICERVIYIDCDTVICESLWSLWKTNLGNNSVGGVIDTVLPQFKDAVGLDRENEYINSGVLLTDIKKWRERKVQDRFIQFIKEHQGQVSHHDQGTINGVLHGEIMVIHPRFNAMTPFFTTRYENLFRLYQIQGRYYSKQELKQAKLKPVIIHYVPEFVGRVWEYECRHPKKNVYKKYMDQTVWKNGLTHSTRRESVKMRLIYWVQCHCFFYNWL